MRTLILPFFRDAVGGELMGKKVRRVVQRKVERQENTRKSVEGKGS